LTEEELQLKRADNDNISLKIFFENIEKNSFFDLLFDKNE